MARRRWSLELERLTAPFRRRLGMKLFAAVCAFVLWFFVNAGERETQVMPFPVELKNLPERAVLTTPDRVDTVAVRVNGPGPLLASLDTKRSPIVLDLSRVEVGSDVRLKVRDDMIRVPRGVRILEIEPPRIPIHLEQLKRASVPVTLSKSGAPRDGYRIEGIRILPEKVVVSGPVSQIDHLESLATEGVDLTDLAASTQRSVGLVRSDQLTVKPEFVKVEIAVAPILVTRDLKHVAVEVRNVDRPFQLRPPRVNLTIRGPQRTMQDLELEDGAVYVDGSTYGPGDHSIEPDVSLPAGVELLKRDPPTVRLEIPEPTPEPKPEPKNGARK